MNARERVGRTTIRVWATTLVVALSAAAASAQCCGAKAATWAEPTKAQSKCPVMGGKINKDLYVDVAGYRLYVCCAGCIDKIKAEPAKYVKKVLANGEKPESRIVVCAKCGEIKGTKKCCAKDASKCAGCGLNKGSAGCCKHLKPAKGETEIVLCAKCGQVKGTSKCCAAGAAKCGKCKLAKGAPGCCRLSDILQ